MIILDTNVISELMKQAPDPSVLVWFKTLNPQPITITVITVAEIYHGIHSLPNGKRRNLLETAFKTMVKEDFQSLILDFDQQAAEIYGKLGAQARSKGKPTSQSDTMIAAIAVSYDAQLATRNVKDFTAFDIDVVNPFEKH